MYVCSKAVQERLLGKLDVVEPNGGVVQVVAYRLLAHVLKLDACEQIFFLKSQRPSTHLVYTVPL